MIAYDKNYEIIREHDKVVLDCERADCVSSDTDIICTASYDRTSLILRDIDDNAYTFKLDENGRANQFICLSVQSKKDEDTETMI